MADNEKIIADTAKKDRSPSFPFIPLEKAIDRAAAMATNHKRTAVRVPVLAETWNYAPKSSGNLQTIGALRQFGLLEDAGSGDNRKVQLTDLAWKILYDTRPGAKETAIREAALKPRLISELWENWGNDRPSDNHCVSELHLDKKFTQESARTFLKVFDQTIAFADLAPSNQQSDSRSDNAVPDHGGRRDPEPGDLVQWVSQGVWQFETPRRVREVLNDGKHGPHVAVEGYGGALPIGQIEIVKRAGDAHDSSSSLSDDPGSDTPHTNPETRRVSIARPSLSGESLGSRQHLEAPASIQRATFPLPEGLAAIEVPSVLSAESYDDLQAWVEVILRRVKRTSTSK